MRENEIKVIDNLLPEDLFNLVKDTLLDDRRNMWAYAPFTLSEQIEERPNNMQMVQMIYADHTIWNDIWNILSPDVFTRINAGIIVRCKANLTFRDEALEDTGWHIDISPPQSTEGLKTGILYFNTVPESVTKIDTGDEIKEVPVIANRFVSFPADMSHTGTTFTTGKCRMVMNFNYYEGVPR